MMNSSPVEAMEGAGVIYSFASQPQLVQGALCPVFFALVCVFK